MDVRRTFSKVDDMRRVLAFELLHCAGNVSILVGMPFQGGLTAEKISVHTLKVKR